MSNHSKWLGVDLHIHSYHSNTVKSKDYKGPDYSGADLLKKLIDNNINIFSVTDHNSVNVKLYKELESEINKVGNKEKINYLVGVELDFYDLKIHKEGIHVLCIFKSKDYIRIEQAVKSLNIDEANSSKPDLDKLFKTLDDYKLNDFLLIPHFNNKGKGLPANDNQIENLNRLIFNAYEDSNNVAQLSKSLNTYLKVGYTDFPFVAFSDCHNINDYPGKNNKGEKLSVCSMLGDIKYPFNSIKTAFEEPRLRIHINKVESMRSNKIRHREFYMNNNNNKVHLSTYSNVIIGSFGSGKSLLINKFLEGIANIDSKYNKIIKKDDLFSIKFDDTKVNSLKEATTSVIEKIITVSQYDELVYTNSINKEYIEKISSNLDFKIPKLDAFKFNYNTDKLFDTIKNLMTHQKTFSNAYNFKYTNAFKENNAYNINAYEPKINFNEYLTKLDDNQVSESLATLKMGGINLFTEDETKTIEDFKIVIDSKINKIQIIENLINSLSSRITENIKNFKQQNNYDHDKNIMETIKQNIKQYIIYIRDFKNYYKRLDIIYNEKVNEKLMNAEEIEEFIDFKVLCKYSIKDRTYKDINSHLFSQNERKETAELSILNAIENQFKLKGKKDLNQIKNVINTYIEEIQELYTENNLTYDIHINSVDKSIMDFSPGERSKEILKLIFSRIEKNCSKKFRTIVVIDQPENNLDNKNIMELIVNNIKNIKLLDKENYITFILVTHNANIAITSDSENIIIAKHEEGEFNYYNGSIENEAFIHEVCEILEGGKEALQARSSKYNIGIKRKVTNNNG